MPSIISKPQSAFIEGRKIVDNILFAQEVVRDYHSNQGLPRCIMKVDIKKAFDYVSWDFLLTVMIVLNFRPRFIHWVTMCLTTPIYSVKINGVTEGFFAS